MAGKEKAEGEIFGVRPQEWGALILAAVVTRLFYRPSYIERPSVPGLSPPAAVRTSTPAQRAQPISSPPPAQVRGAAHVAPLPQLAVEAGLVGTDVREHEPIPVLVNELFSPDPEVRM